MMHSQRSFKEKKIIAFDKVYNFAAHIFIKIFIQTCLKTTSLIHKIFQYEFQKIRQA